MFSLLAIALALAGAQDASPPTLGIEGVWANPSNSVQVRTGRCADKLCGWVVWASEKAKADTKRKAGGPLIGVALLRDYYATGKNRWAGQLFVPDMNSSYNSTIVLLDSQTLRIKGCILGGLICKSQDWRRVAGASATAER